MQLSELLMSRFGSRFCLSWQPAHQQMTHGARGKFYDEPLDFALGVSFPDEDDEREAMPYTKKYPVSRDVEQHVTMTGASIRCHFPDYVVRLTLDALSPFYPRDEHTTLAPFIVLDVGVEKFEGRARMYAPAEGKAFLRVALPPGTGNSVTYEGNEVVLRYESGKQRVEERIRVVGADGIEAPVGEGGDVFRIPFVVDSDAPQHLCTLIWATHVPDVQLATRRGDAVFKYTKMWPNVTAVLDWAEANLPAVRAKCHFFDELFTQYLDAPTGDLFAYAFHAFASNAWWGTLPDGRDWWSVWEGNCRFHSTVDVEYNDGLLYYALWPELLDLTLDEWTEHFKPNVNGLWHMSHDMGGGDDVTGQHYPHEMEVEENTDYVLMLHALWKQTGDADLIKRNADVLLKIMQHTRGVDTNDTGFANTGCANTIDDAAPAIQYSREQTYLGVKMHCAAAVAVEMAEVLEDEALADYCRVIRNRTRQTLDERAWLGDHYAITINPSNVGLKAQFNHVYDPTNFNGEELPGWDAYTLYTSNGLLYPLMAGFPLELDLGRMRQDLVAGLEHSMAAYGCTHSSADRTTGWLSQNMWRDWVGIYLGVMREPLSAKYWAWNEVINGSRNGGIFTDTFKLPHLFYYPRGTTMFGYFWAKPRLSIDAPNGVVRVAPLAAPLELPLLAFIDWEKQVVPLIKTEVVEGRIVTSVSHADLVEARGLRLELE
jgi:hypothetical protein